MPKVDIVHDEYGNVHGFAVHPDKSDRKTGSKLQEGQKLSTVEISHDLKAHEDAFLKAVHNHARQNAAKR